MLTPTENQFIHKKHLIYYDRDNINNLEKDILYYLTNKNERLKIAKEGHLFALKYHTYKNRANEIINKLN
jgi:spore maturation protein CgeB